MFSELLAEAMENKEGKGMTNKRKERPSQEEDSSGLVVTEEQVSDTLTEGTIEAEIDQVDDQGHLISHHGEKIRGKNHR